MNIMKDTNFLNLFWAIVWGLITVLAVVGIFWKPAIFIVIAAAASLCGMFIYDYVRVKRMK